MRVHRASAAALICLAGCGGGGGDGGGLNAAKSGARTDADVIRAWSDAVRRRDYARAADLFAVPSTIVNGGRVRAERRSVIDRFNRSLSCGAVLTRTAPAGEGRLLATFKLVRGAGGGGSSCSGKAQVRFRIQKGRITEWIRTSTGPPPDAQET